MCCWQSDSLAATVLMVIVVMVMMMMMMARTNATMEMKIVTLLSALLLKIDGCGAHWSLHQVRSLRHRGHGKLC